MRPLSSQGNVQSEAEAAAERVTAKFRTVVVSPARQRAGSGRDGSLYRGSRCIPGISGGHDCRSYDYAADTVASAILAESIICSATDTTLNPFVMVERIRQSGSDRDISLYFWLAE